MALPKPTAAITRLREANNRPYDAANNPGGLAEGGHRQNWVENAQAEIDVSQWTESLAADADTDAQATAADRVQTGQDRTAAGTSAGRAAESEAAASRSATASAESAREAGTRLVATSTTSNAIGTGSKTFTIQAGKAYGVGSRLAITNDAAPSTRIMYGTVTAYSDTTLTVSVDNTLGSGTYAAWTIRLSGDRGAIGPVGPVPFTTPVAWASGATYVVGPPASSVVFEGESYVCIASHTSSATITPTDTTRWRKLAAKGADGATPAVDLLYALNLHFGA